MNKNFWNFTNGLVHAFKNLPEFVQLNAATNLVSQVADCEKLTPDLRQELREMVGTLLALEVEVHRQTK